MPAEAVLGLPGLVAVALAIAPGFPAWPGLLHLVALPPLDLLADVRLLVSRAPSHPAFVLGIAVAVAARALLLAALLPGGVRQRLRLTAAVYLVTLPLALLAAQLSFIAHAALHSRLFWVAVAVTGVTGLLLAAAPWTDEATLPRAVAASLRAGLRPWPLAAYAGALTAIGALASLGGSAATAALVPVSAALTLATARWLRRPLRPGGAWLGTLAAVALAAATSAAVILTRGSDPIDAAPRPGSVIAMSGISSTSGHGAVFEMPPDALGYDCDQTYYYSYAGTGDGQPRGEAACPVRTGAPYRPEHTQRPFDEQVKLLAAQAGGLEPPLLVAAHSQAAWVAWDAAARGDLPPGTSLLLIGPLPKNLVGWPLPGETGLGRVGGDGFRLLSPLLQAAGFAFVVDAPLSRDVLARPGASQEIFSRRLPDGVRALAVTATSDLALMSGGWRLEGAQDACPVREAHPHLPLAPALHEATARFLDGDEQPPCPTWRQAIATWSRPWGVPPHTR